MPRSLEIALIENLQRKDLSPLEEADGYLTLQERHGYTHEQIAKAVGKSRVTITETLSLARLPLRVKDECRRADIRSKSFLLEVGRLPNEPAMLDAIVAFGSGEGVGQGRRQDGAARGGAGRNRPLPELPESLRAELPAAGRRVRRKPRLSREAARTEPKSSRPSAA